MSQPNRCPQCGSPLPLDAPPGICPRCILALGFQPQFKVQGSKFKVDEPQPPRDFEPGTLNLEPAQRGSRFVPPKPNELAPLFPQLDILDLLGHGGMGAVYKARQTKLDRLVALKILPPEVGQDPAFAERFIREAKTLGQLAHPGIVGIHDFGQAGNLYYLIMEYVDGSNLRQVIEAGALAPEQALAIVPQVCEALQYAHDEGVVHRDIKPENILLDKKGRAKIADFGLAKLLARPAGSFTLTDTQQVMGTPHYMAPEQLTSTRAVDHRADIYSLGVVFYEMLTGELPLGRFDPPSKKSGVDARLDEVVLRTLERTPERRYQQAGQVKTDVESISRLGHQQPTVMYVTPPALSSEEADKLAEARFLVKGPAIGMMICGIAALVQSWAIWQKNWDMPQYWISGHSFPLAAIMLIGVPYGAVMLAAGWQMLRLRTYTLGVLAGIMAYLLPLGILPLIAWPVAIWTHIVLYRQVVCDAFAIHLRQRIAASRLEATQRARPVWLASLSTASGGMLKQAWAWALRIDAGIFVLSLAGVASLLMPWYQFALEPKPTIPPLPSLGNAAILGLNLWQGLLVAAICAAFSVAWLAFGRNAGRLGGILALIAGLIVAAASIQFCLSPSLTSNAVPSWDFALQAYWGIKSAPQYEFITSGPLVGPFVAIVSGFGLMLLGGLRIGTAAALDSKATTTFPWTELGFGLCLLLPTLALICFALIWTQSAWTLAALAVPWFAMGCWGGATSGTPKEIAANVVFIVMFLASLALIAGGVWLENSALPLLAVLVCGGAMIPGVGIAYAVQEDEKSAAQTKGERVPEEDEDEEDEDEDDEEDDEEDETAEDALSTPATWMAIVGGIGCWWLLSDGGTFLQKVAEGKDVAARWDLLALAGAPIVLVGGLLGRAVRGYWLVLVASVLCLPLGLVADDFLVRVVPFGIGIWMLILLARADIRSAFWDTDRASKPAESKRPASEQIGPDGWPIAPAMPAAEPVAKRPRGTLGRAWDAWWGERDRWFTSLVQAILALVAVGCLLMYLNFHLANEATPGDAKLRHTTIQFGFPDAWFHYEAYPEPSVPFRWRINYFSWSSLVMLAGCLAWYVYWQIERAKPEAKWLWLGSANTIILFWGLLSACVAIGALLANLP